MTGKGILAAAVAASLSGSAYAATYTWTGTSGTNWSDTTQWVDESSVAGFPQAGDLAQLIKPVTAWTYIDFQGGAAVGSMYVRPEWDSNYRVRSTWGGSRTFAFSNGLSDSVVTLSSATNSATYTGNLIIGEDSSAINVNLASDLVVNNDGTRLANGRLIFGALSTITGGSAADRAKLTTRALGTGKITTTVSGGATFVGDWVVDGPKATLDMNANSFGDASNSVDLLNGGVLDLNNAAFNAFSWNRSLSGTGTVIANPNGFALGAGSFDLAGNGTTADKLTITGNLVLGANSTLNLTGTFAGDAIPLVVATGTVTGTFATVNLPAGYDIAYSPSGITLVIPEPGTIALGCGLGMLLICRRRRAALA